MERINEQVGTVSISVSIETGKVSSMTTAHDPRYTETEFLELVRSRIDRHLQALSVAAADGRGTE